DSSKYLIWYEDEHGKNQVYTIDNKIACFASEQSAKNMIYKSDLCYMATEIYDLKRIEYWVSTCNPSKIINSAGKSDRDLLLEFWNLFDDIHYSLGSEFEPVIKELSRKCYEKLLFGSELNEDQQPVQFTEEELEFIRKLMIKGLEHLRNNCVILNHEL
ncbi:MAG: hypothetical protein J5582_08335, partial [Ruminococcus sp.]|uniref:hypothetical protein n=1 Tax=Ruminococcus sp. TaxID=41978 RepID=UPI0025DBBFF3